MRSASASSHFDHLVGGVGLPAFDIRLDVSRRHQMHLMAELYQLARPVMRRAARLDADHATRQLGEKWQHLRPPKQLANDNLAGCINAVDLRMLLAKSRPIVVIFKRMAPILLVNA